MTRNIGSLFFVLAVVVGASACERDLSVPEGPQRGSVSGAVDTGGHLSPSGHEVALVSEEGSKLAQTTGDDGAFVFGDVAPGTYYLELNVPGFAPLIRPSIRVEAGAATDVGTLAPAWLQGTSDEARVIGRVSSGGGGEVNGAQVEFVLQGVDERIALTTVGPDGAFIQTVPPGLYTLRVSHPFHVTSTVTDLTVPAGQRVDLTAQPIVLDVNPATLAGSLLRERDRDTAVPASGVVVTVGNGQTTTTDAQGNFQLQGLPAGLQTVRFSLANHHDVVPERTISLEAGKTLTLEAMTLQLDRGAITGTVALSDQKPVLGAQVRLTGTPYAAAVTPSSTEPWKGSFLITGVPVGTYEVVAEKTNYPPAARPAQQVSANATRTVSPDFTLQPLLGDFEIDDGDATNAPGYTRSTQVTLKLLTATNATEYRASEDPAFAGVAFSPLTTTTPVFTLTSAQGNHYVYVQYKDASGAVSATFSSSIILDSVAPANPSLKIEDGAGFTNKAQVLRLSLHADEAAGNNVDAVSGLSKVRISEASTTDAQGNLQAPAQTHLQTIAHARQTTGDGVQNIYAQFLDGAGNASAVVSASIVVDTAPPSGSVSIQKGPLATANGYTNTTFVEVQQQAAAEPNGGFVSIKLANSSADLAAAVFQPLQAVGNWFLIPGSDGPRTVHAVLQDAAGNQSGALTATIMLDATAPSPVSATGPAITNSNDIILSLAAADASGLSPTQAVTASQDFFFQGTGNVGPLAFPTSSQLPFTLSGPDGRINVFVRFRDVAGNDASVTVPVTLDTTAPKLKAFAIEGTLADSTPSQKFTSTPNVSLLIDHEGATSYAAVPGILMACPTTGYVPLGAGPVAYTLGATTTVSVCVRDAAGNLDGPSSSSITLDTSVPTGCALNLSGRKTDDVTSAPAGKTGVRDVDQTLTSCTEQPAEIFFTDTAVTCSTNGAFTWLPYSAALRVPLSGADGAKTIRGCVRDAARNVGSLAQATIALDTTPPGAPGVRIDSGAAYVNADEVATRGGYKANVEGIATGAVEWAFNETGTFAGVTFVSLATNNPVLHDFGSGGPKTVQAVFRDDVGNTTQPVSDSIEFDVTPPDTSGWTLTIPSASTVSTLTRNRVIGVQLMNPGLGFANGPPGVILVEAQNSAACAAGDFAGATVMPIFSTGSFLLSEPDGLKRICLRLVDAAGNPSTGILTATIELDSTPPTTPVIVTPPEVVSRRSAQSVMTYDVKLASPVADANFSHYEVVGGATNTTVGTQATTSFTFTLNENATLAAGLVNVLSIRAHDLAGNVSPVASVSITNDTSLPAAPVVNAAWVDNRSGRATFHWGASSSPDVVSYEVRYGAAAGSYSGQYAFEGVSPIPVGLQTWFGLSGLQNGNITYVKITAVDHAGNRRDSAAELMLQPHEVSPNFVGGPFVTSAHVAHMTARGDLLFVLGRSTVNCGSSTSLQLRIADLSEVASPLMTGAVAPAVLPPIIGTYNFPDPMNLNVCGQGVTNIVVEGPYAFVPVGTKIHVVDVSNPSAPIGYATIDTGVAVQNVVVRGDRLFAAGANNQLFAVSLARLYDQDPLTRPDAADLIGTATNGVQNPGALLLTRGTLIQIDSMFGRARSFSAFHATDADTTTAWDGTDIIGGEQSFLTSKGSAVISGNTLYAANNSGTRLYTLAGAWAQSAPVGPSDLAFTNASANHNTHGLEVLGSQYFVMDGLVSTIKGFDLTNMASPVQVAGTRVTATLTSTAAWGPYFLAGTTQGQVQIFETARPDGLRIVSRTPGFAARGEVAGAFFYGSGLAFDLQDGTERVVGPTAGVCGYGQARFEDRVLQARGTQLTTWSFDHALDRNTGTAFNQFNSVSTSLPIGTKAVAAEAWGTFLVLVEQRSDGMYLEVFDTARLRNNNSPVALTSASSRGALKFATTVGRAELTVTRGRAFVVVGGSAPTLYAVDLRPLFDDDSTTVVSASSIQGTVPVPAGSGLGSGELRAVTARGNYAYVATSVGLSVVDTSAAMDENPATLMPSTTASTQLPLSWGASAVTVEGSYALLIESAKPYGQGFIKSLDVSVPTAPVVLASVPITSPQYECLIDGSSVEMRPTIQMLGSRAYVGFGTELVIVELE